MQERREHGRILFHRDVNVTLPNGTVVDSTAHDFTMHGMGITIRKPLAEGDTVNIKFKILTHGNWRNIDLRGKVAYSMQENTQYKVGICFY